MHTDPKEREHDRLQQLAYTVRSALVVQQRWYMEAEKEKDACCVQASCSPWDRPRGAGFNPSRAGVLCTVSAIRARAGTPRRGSLGRHDAVGL